MWRVRAHTCVRARASERAVCAVAAAAAAHVRATLVRAAGAAPDHTLDPGYPEGRYLTNLTYRITPE